MEARSIVMTIIFGKECKHINISEESKINEVFPKYEIHKYEEIILPTLEYKQLFS